jgi:hypothetical protein
MKSKLDAKFDRSKTKSKSSQKQADWLSQADNLTDYQADRINGGGWRDDEGSGGLYQNY